MDIYKNHIKNNLNRFCSLNTKINNVTIKKKLINKMVKSIYRNVEQEVLFSELKPIKSKYNSKTERIKKKNKFHKPIKNIIKKFIQKSNKFNIKSINEINSKKLIICSEFNQNNINIIKKQEKNKLKKIIPVFKNNKIIPIFKKSNKKLSYKLRYPRFSSINNKDFCDYFKNKDNYLTENNSNIKKRIEIPLSERQNLEELIKIKNTMYTIKSNNSIISGEKSERKIKVSVVENKPNKNLTSIIKSVTKIKKPKKKKKMNAKTDNTISTNRKKKKVKILKKIKDDFILKKFTNFFQKKFEKLDSKKLNNQFSLGINKDNISSITNSIDSQEKNLKLKYNQYWINIIDNLLNINDIFKKEKEIGYYNFYDIKIDSIIDNYSNNLLNNNNTNVDENCKLNKLEIYEEKHYYSKLRFYLKINKDLMNQKYCFETNKYNFFN